MASFYFIVASLVDFFSRFSSWVNKTILRLEEKNNAEIDFWNIIVVARIIFKTIFSSFHKKFVFVFCQKKSIFFIKTMEKRPSSKVPRTHNFMNLRQVRENTLRHSFVKSLFICVGWKGFVIVLKALYI